MKIGVIVQARMTSRRFPGKVLHEVAGKPILQYLIERLRHCHSLDAIVIATSTDQSDLPIANFCQEHNLACYRGSLLDVASRFKEILDEYQFDSFVRISGDSPLLDQRLIEQSINIFLKNDIDLVTNVLIRTYPKGQSVEVVCGDTFRAIYPLMREAEELEHVTSYFYTHKEDFKIFNLETNKYHQELQLSVDTPQDMNKFAAIIAKMNRPHWEYGLDEILSIHQSLFSVEIQ